MIESVSDRLQARFAHRLLEQAKREIGHPRPRLTGRLMIAFILSILVLLTPFLLIIGGVVLIWTTWANLFSIIIGLILIGFGYVLLPPRNRTTQKTYRRADLPTLFALLDDIAARLGTTAPDGVHFDHEFNAYMGAVHRTIRAQAGMDLGDRLDPVGSVLACRTHRASGA